MLEHADKARSRKKVRPATVAELVAEFGSEFVEALAVEFLGYPLLMVLDDGQDLIRLRKKCYERRE